MSSWDSFFAFFNGMVAGWSQVFVMQPFEIIKVRLQTQPVDNKIYNGIIDCIKKIFVNEGPLAFYKGTVTPLIGVGILGSARFGLFQNFKRKIAQYQNINSTSLDLPSRSLAALMTGMCVTFLVVTSKLKQTPVEHTRIRVQIQRTAADKVYSGSLDALFKITKNHGLRGLYRGLGPSAIRQSTGITFYFSTIEALTHLLNPNNVDKKNLPFYVPFLAGGIGGTAYWVFNYPFDYVKTLMQTDKFGSFKYNNMISVFKDQYKVNGIQTFYKGFVICMLRSFPVNAAALVTYRLMQRISKVSSN